MRALWLDRILLLLSFAGIYVSGVLTILGADVPCTVGGGCAEVARHPTSHLIAGIPNSAFGMAMYILLAVLAILRLFGVGKRRPNLVAGYAITALGTLASIALTYISVTVVKAECIWCLTSAGLVILSMIGYALQFNATELAHERHGFDLGFTGVLALGTVIALGAHWATYAGNTHIEPKAIWLTITPEKLVPKDVHIYGNPKAPLTIVEFGDLVCPTCAHEYPDIRDFVDKSRGKVRYIFRHFPMKLHGHEMALRAAFLAEAADEKKVFWNFVTAMYDGPNRAMTVEDLQAVLRRVGLDPAETFKRSEDENSSGFKRALRDINTGNEYGLSGTPTYYIMDPAGKIDIASTDVFKKLREPQYQAILNAQ